VNLEAICLGTQLHKMQLPQALKHIWAEGRHLKMFIMLLELNKSI
jgi:hypothetical protein